MRELDFIRWVSSQGGMPSDVVPVGPGDDTAVVLSGDERLLITCDQVLDEVHARLKVDGGRAIGRKALARNLSDIAAMGGEPLCAVVTVALPPACDEPTAREIYHGMRELGEEFGCPIVGGDVAAWDQRLLVSVTVLGRPAGIEPVLRSGGRAGDWLCVTGRLGGAWRTDRHLTFPPRIPEARLLAEQYDLHAMIDLSDGLATDLGHICRASGLGALVQAAGLPIHPDVAQLEDPLMAAMTDGEDYELLVALPPAEARRLLDDQPLPVAVSRVGQLRDGEGIHLRRADGSVEGLTESGWEHRT